MHPYTNAQQNESKGARIMVRGENIFVYDEEGKEYLDGMAGLWSASLGFSEHRLAEVAARQMRQLPFYHYFTGSGTDVAALLAERLVGMAPVPMSKVFFVSSGSEAIDTAVKMAWYHNNALGRHQKKKIISRQKAYHGVTLAAASLTGRIGNHQDFDLPLERFYHVGCPHYYRFALPGESEEEFSIRLTQELENFILEEGSESIAAFVAEPIQASGGVLIPPMSYFDKVQKILRKYDILFIVDEVVCGFYRTGSLWGSQLFDLKPDMMIMAKQLSASYAPIGALMLNERTFRPVAENSARLGNFGHGYTYGGHPLSAAIALATLDIYQKDNISLHVERVAPIFEMALKRFQSHPLVGEVRVCGLMGAIELVEDKNTSQSFSPEKQIGPQMVAFCRVEGLILRNAGDSLCFSPPLIITIEQIEEMINRFARALKRLEEWLEKNNGF